MQITQLNKMYMGKLQQFNAKYITKQTSLSTWPRQIA